MTGGGGLARVPEPACVRAPLHEGLHTQREEGRSNFLPWYRLVGVESTSSQTHKEGRPGLPINKGKWSPREHGEPTGSTPSTAQQPAVIGGSKGCARIKGKAGENGQN